MRRQLPIIALNVVLVLVMLLHSIGIRTLPALDRLENFFYDIRTQLTLVGGVDNRIVIVDIDERSLREEGHWPWSREKLAVLTDRLFDQYGVAALGYDVVFAERDETREIHKLRSIAESLDRAEFIRELDDMAIELDRDRLFADAFTDRPVALGYYFNINPERDTSTGALPAPIDFAEPVKRSLFPPVASSYGANIDVLQENALGGGFFSNPLIGQDGVVRRVPTLHEYQGDYYESFSIAVIRAYLGLDIEPALADIDPDTGYPRLEGIFVGPFHVPIDVNGGALVPYRGRSGSFPYVSATDVVRGEIADAEVLRDAIALVGTTSLGLVDIRATPVQATFPGVEIHANVIAGVLDESFKHRPAWIQGAELASLFSIGLLMIVMSPILGPARLLAFGLIILVIVVGSNFYLWNEKQLVMPLANSVVLVFILYITSVSYGYFTEAKQKRQVRTAFSHYLAPAIVKKLTEHPDQLRLSGETREMTFLFSDIAGFTSFTEKSDPEVLVALLNEYLDEMCQIAMSHGGTIDKIVGDAVHAMFNAPVDQPDHASRAVACALEMDEFCTKFKKEKNQAGLDFGITRVGVNTGITVVGNFGGSARFDYTAHGDVINTAARMESVNKHLGTRICVSGSTVSGCPDHFFRPVGALVLKGKTEAIEAFEPITREQHDSDRIRRYLEAFRRLEEQQPDSAALFCQLKSEYPDDPLVALHYDRITAGETSTTIVLAEK